MIRNTLKRFTAAVIVIAAGFAGTLLHIEGGGILIILGVVMLLGVAASDS